MICKACNYPATQVVRTHHTDNRMKIIRERLCVKCGLRFRTQENYRDSVNKESKFFEAIGK